MGLSTRIGRRIMSTTCDCLIVNDKNDTEKKTVILAGDYSNETRATNACKKRLGVKRLLVQRISTESNYYSMPISEFVKHANKAKVKAKKGN